MAAIIIVNECVRRASFVERSAHFMTVNLIYFCLYFVFGSSFLIAYLLFIFVRSLFIYFIGLLMMF